MKILCIGRNYAKHAAEMGTAGKLPVWFWKPDSAVIGDGDPVVLPPGIGEVHHEVELAVRFGMPARRLSAGDALRHLDAFTVAVDVTARDLQAAAKAAGEPWAMAKGFDTFLPLGAPQPLDVDLQELRLRLALDGEVRQDGSTVDMVRSVPRLVAEATAWTTMRPGDWLLTGTPEGVGPMRAGQKMLAEVVGHVALRTPVVDGPAATGP